MAKDYFGMQQDALRRAREMYSRGKPQEINKKETLKQEENKNPVLKNQNTNKNQGIIEFLLKDKDTTIILALLILLSGEKTDSSLIFALLFLLT